jgi:glycosyltransferase involved in cell wall biosynthesis
MNFRIGFDISQLAHTGGVTTYTRKIAEGLQKNRSLEMVFFYSSLRKPYNGALKGVKKFKLPPTLFELLFNKLRNVSIEKFLGPLDIYHSSDWVQPPSKARKVTTYHDLVPIIHPEWSVPKIVEVHRRRLKLVEKEIDMVIAVSKATKNDLIKVSNIPAEKITVIYEGVDEKFRVYPVREVELFRKKYNLPKDFVLAIGGIGERKNLKRLKVACKELPLIVTHEDLSVTDDELPLLYCASRLLAYPSLYEGFGLPVLEAQACGVPVVTSDVSSLPEVGGDAAAYVDPMNIKSMQKTIQKVFYDDAVRKEMIKLGFKNVKLFTWDKTIAETIEVYRKLME